MKGEVDTSRQSTTVVAHDIHQRAHPLPAHASQDTTTRPVEPIRDLEQRDVRHDLGHQSHDPLIIVKQPTKHVLGPQEHGEDHRAQNRAQHRRTVGRAPRLPRAPCAEQVAQAHRGRDAEAKGHGVDDLVGGHDDALRGERDGAQPARGEGDDLKGPPLGADVDDAEEGEAGEAPQVLQAFAWGEAAPALVAADKDRVDDEEQEGKPVGESRGEGRAVEAEAEGVDEEVVEESVEG